jgi:hypothetical protein
VKCRQHRLVAGELDNSHAAGFAPINMDGIGEKELFKSLEFPISVVITLSRIKKISLKANDQKKSDLPVDAADSCWNNVLRTTVNGLQRCFLGTGRHETCRKH